MSQIELDSETESNPLHDVAQRLLDKAGRAGATDASVRITESEGMQVAVRNQTPTKRIFQQHTSITLTYHDGMRRASASSNDTSPQGLARMVEAARDLARITAPDACNGATESEYFAPSRDLALYHPWDLDSRMAIDIACRIESAGFEVDPAIQSEGASVSATTGRFILATSRGFLNSYPWSNYGLSFKALAMRDGRRQIDGWGDSSRIPLRLETPESVGRKAGQRALRRLDARQIGTRRCSVLFEPQAAVGLLEFFVGAASGQSLYNGASFLADSLGKLVFSPHVDLIENPFELAGNGSRPFDGDGISATPREIVSNGILTGYFLGLYAARRLKLDPTGNESGPTNLRIRSSQTQPGDDFVRMLDKLGTGLLVCGTSGQGVNLLTGDFSQAAHGFWVEKGRIVFPVDGITIAANLRQMFSEIAAVGADIQTQGAWTSGSWLIPDMTVGGA